MRAEDKRGGKKRDVRTSGRKIAMSVAVGGVALATVAACGQTAGGGPGEQNAEGLSEVTVTLNWVPYGEHAPFYYGVAEGIFEDEGIDLTIQPGNGSGNTVQQVAQRNTASGGVSAQPKSVLRCATCCTVLPDPLPGWIVRSMPSSSKIPCSTP